MSAELRRLLCEIRHILTAEHGLYAKDIYEKGSRYQIDHKDLLQKIDAALEITPSMLSETPDSGVENTKTGRNNEVATHYGIGDVKPAADKCSTHQTDNGLDINRADYKEVKQFVFLTNAVVDLRKVDAVTFDPVNSALGIVEIGGKSIKIGWLAARQLMSLLASSDEVVNAYARVSPNQLASECKDPNAW